jgi:DNA-binding CsgD family transcriptional regulator
LTPREAEVLALIAHGCAFADVAQHLTISPLTVDTHVRNIRLKLGVSTVTHAVFLVFASSSASEDTPLT